MAMTIVEKSGGQYHVLLIIADGQFVNFTEIMSKNVAQSRKETEFALAALMEIPSQYKATIELNILGSKSSCSSNFQQSSAPYHGHSSPVSKAPPASSSTFDNQRFDGHRGPARMTGLTASYDKLQNLTTSNGVLFDL
ncbi:hypothetical protein ACSBR1_014675 [Camellia fascicularis]